MYFLSRRPWQICTPKKQSGVKAAVKTRTRSSVGRPSCNTQEYRFGKRAACPSQQLCLPLPALPPRASRYLFMSAGDMCGHICEGRTRMISQTGASFSIELLTTCTRLGSALHLGAGRGAAGSSSLLREQWKRQFSPQEFTLFCSARHCC